MTYTHGIHHLLEIPQWPQWHIWFHYLAIWVGSCKATWPGGCQLCILTWQCGLWYLRPKFLLAYCLNQLILDVRPHQDCQSWWECSQRLASLGGHHFLPQCEEFQWSCDINIQNVFHSNFNLWNNFTIFRVDLFLLLNGNCVGIGTITLVLGFVSRLQPSPRAKALWLGLICSQSLRPWWWFLKHKQGLSSFSKANVVGRSALRNGKFFAVIHWFWSFCIEYA